MNQSSQLIIEFVKNTKVNFYYLPTDPEVLKKVERYKLVNCSCPAYARERQLLLAQISEAVSNGFFEEIPQDVAKTNYQILRILV